MTLDDSIPERNRAVLRCDDDVHLDGNSVMVRRFVASTIGTLVLLVATAGCANENLDWNMDPVDAVGVWKATYPGFDGVLRLNADGTFNATDWPKDLCAPAISSLNQLDFRLKVSFSGEYDFSDGVPYAAYLLSSDHACDGITFYFWKGADARRRIQIDLIPADGSEPTEYVRLERAG